MSKDRASYSNPLRLAPLSLIVAALIFTVTLPFRNSFLGGLLHAFGEAAMVGGLADWFAVVALFRHPMGIPIPHTAIIPRHRNKLTASIIDMVQNRWLTRDTILEHIGAWNFGAALAQWLRETANRAALLNVLRGLLRDTVGSADSGRLGDLLMRLLRERVSDDDILRALRSLATQLMRQGHHNTALNVLLERLGPWLQAAEVRALIIRNLKAVAEEYAESPIRRLGKWMAESVNALNYDDLADAIIRTIADELRAIREQEQHPARADVNAWLHSFVDQLERQEALRRSLAKWREDMVDSGRAAAQLRDILERGRAWLLRDIDSEHSTSMHYLAQLLDQALDAFVQNSAAQQSLDGWIKERIAWAVDQYHGQIGAMVQRNLDRLDNDTLVRQIEEKVGPDLQFIRLNGAIVGGSVGMLLYLLKIILPV